MRFLMLHEKDISFSSHFSLKELSDFLEVTDDSRDLDLSRWLDPSLSLPLSFCLVVVDGPKRSTSGSAIPTWNRLGRPPRVKNTRHERRHVDSSPRKRQSDCQLINFTTRRSGQPRIKFLRRWIINPSNSCNTSITLRKRHETL